MSTYLNPDAIEDKSITVDKLSDDIIMTQDDIVEIINAVDSINVE